MEMASVLRTSGNARTSQDSDLCIRVLQVKPDPSTFPPSEHNSSDCAQVKFEPQDRFWPGFLPYRQFQDSSSVYATKLQPSHNLRCRIGVARVVLQFGQNSNGVSRGKITDLFDACNFGMARRRAPYALCLSDLDCPSLS